MEAPHFTSSTSHLAAHEIIALEQLLALLLQKLQEEATYIQNESIKEVQAGQDFVLPRWLLALNHPNSWASQMLFIPWPTQHSEKGEEGRTDNSREESVPHVINQKNCW